MVVDKDRERKEDFVLDGENIEAVESFVYLGSLINTKGSSAQEIRRRLAMGRGAVQNMVSIWKSRGMSFGLKVRFLIPPRHTGGAVPLRCLDGINRSGTAIVAVFPQ